MLGLHCLSPPLKSRHHAQSSSHKGMYRVKGEDAITKWPKAMESVIQDRDTYMAAGLKAIANGASQSCHRLQLLG